MRYIFLVLFMIVLGGCSSLPLNSSLLPVASQAMEPTLGMTRPQVAALMTRTVTVGYEIDPVTGEAKPLEAKSLYSTEVVPVGNETYLVDSYIIGVPLPGHPVTASGLMPMIFKDDLLCGKGRDALAALKAGRQ